MTLPSIQTRRKAEAGYSLLEIMVGLLIASISLLLVMQAVVLFEEQKRSVVSGDDAESFGALGFYSLQRDVRQSGYGITPFNLISCDLLLDSAAGRGNITLPTLVPVKINDPAIPPGDPNTDTVMVIYGNSPSEPEGSQINAYNGNDYTVESGSSFLPGDKVMAGTTVRPSPCQLSLDTVSNVVGQNVTVTAGSAGLGDRLYNLGPEPKMLVYAVRGGYLTLCDYAKNDCGFAGNLGGSSVWKPVVGNIVSLRAQYGRDTTVPMDAIVDVFDQTSPVAGSPFPDCDWSRIAAVRLVVVARNSQPNKQEVTLASLLWEGSANTPIDLSATDVVPGFSWKNYRYKTFETIISIRNIAQAGRQEGC